MTNEIWVRCGSCNHRWIAVYLPQTMSRVSKILGHLICPKCAESGSKIFMCKPETEENDD